METKVFESHYSPRWIRASFFFGGLLLAPATVGISLLFCLSAVIRGGKITISGKNLAWKPPMQFKTEYIDLALVDSIQDKGGGRVRSVVLRSAGGLFRKKTIPRVKDADAFVQAVHEAKRL